MELHCHRLNISRLWSNNNSKDIIVLLLVIYLGILKGRERLCRGAAQVDDLRLDRHSNLATTINRQSGELLISFLDDTHSVTELELEGVRLLSVLAFGGGGFDRELYQKRDTLPRSRKVSLIGCHFSTIENTARLFSSL